MPGKINTLIDMICLKMKHPSVKTNGVHYIKPGTEVADISMDLRVNLWSDGLTGNYFSMTFDRGDIEKFYTYLLLVTNKIDKNDEKIQKLIEAGILYEEEQNVW